MIDIRLKVFCCVAANLSFTKASQELFISQPAISKHIQELEKEYDVRLFDRMGNRIQLTREGLLLLGHAERILRGYQKMDYEMKALQQWMVGVLRIGASTTISQYVMPEIIAAFRKQFPYVKITMLSGNSREVEAALVNGRVDIGMVEGTVRQPELKYTPFMADRLVAIVNAKSTLAKNQTITVEQLKKIPVVFREFGSGTLDVIQQALQKEGVGFSDLNIEMNFGTTEGIKHYVEHSDCMGIVSIRSVDKEIYANLFKVIDIEGMHIERELMLVEKRGEASGVLKKLRLFITKNYKV